jgi:uncharacterized protein
MVHLLDVNLLVALAWPNHIHHTPAHAWFAANHRNGWATCPIVQCGFVRVSSNPKAVVAAVSPGTAVEALGKMSAWAEHVFWPDDVELSDPTYVPPEVLRGHQQVTDAYLIGLAHRHGGALATLDRGLAAPLPGHRRRLVAVVPT